MEYRPRAAPGRDLGGLGDGRAPAARSERGATSPPCARNLPRSAPSADSRAVRRTVVIHDEQGETERLFSPRPRASARAKVRHTLENVRICERKERRITYVVKKMCLERTRGIIIQFRDFPNVRITFADNVRTANARCSRTAHVPSDAPRNTRTCERLRTDRERKRKQGSPAPKGKTPLSFIPSARRTRRHGRRTPCGRCRSRRASRLSA